MSKTGASSALSASVANPGEGDGSSAVEAVGRFAPSPTGRMHAGNIFAALMAWLVAKSQGGRIILRIEDLDRQRSKREYIDAVQRDLEFLGLRWDEGPYYQHDRDEAYRAAFEALAAKDVLYPCFCSRADLHVASAPHRGEKLVYPGTCRRLSPKEREARAKLRQPATRIAVPSRRIGFTDLVQGPYAQTLDEDCGDFLVRRSDGMFAYQLAVVVDDAAQGVTSVVRGVDLLSSTPQQIYLQQMLGASQPAYAHIPLLVSREGRRLSKRDHDASLDALLDRFGTAEGILGHLAWLAGLRKVDEPESAEGLLAGFSVAELGDLFADPVQILWR